MFGISRSRAAELVRAGLVRLDDVAAAKSDRLVPGALLEVTFPQVADPLEVVAEVVEGMRIVHDDDEVVVVDKPVGGGGASLHGLDRAHGGGPPAGGRLPDRHQRGPGAAGHRAAARRRHVGG